MTTTDPLVTTEWLAARLDQTRLGQSRAGGPRLHLLEANFKLPGATPTVAEDYAARHLPGALFFDIDAVADRASPLPHMLPTADEFGRDIGALGIGNDDTVVVYDAGAYMGAPRAWWTFRAFGHRDVFVLDGGMKKWLAEGRPVEAGQNAPSASGRYRARLDPSRVRDMAQLVANVGTCSEQVIDARSRERFEGAAPEPWPGRRSGRIPGSRCMPFAIFTDAETGVFKSVPELRQLFADAGVDLRRPIVTTCGSGISAATITVALARLGVDDSAVYDGSWAEWGLPGGPEVATGPA
jgi:thiosulfate/3-mercaptopyruvate sulfurtransferase